MEVILIKEAVVQEDLLQPAEVAASALRPVLNQSSETIFVSKSTEGQSKENAISIMANHHEPKR